ncbi:hypothetical protein E4U27_002527 [Claviceps purpurea]|nr:hypothetical protein E4U27_002527 [Claviceps purpurea]
MSRRSRFFGVDVTSTVSRQGKHNLDAGDSIGFSNARREQKAQANESPQEPNGLNQTREKRD